MEYDDRSQMVFAQIHYPQDYPDVHADMVALIQSQFPHVESGLQCGSWIWVMDGDGKVAIDTFTAMKHQVKLYNSGPLVQRVIDALQVKYDVQVFDKPADEWARHARTEQQVPSYFPPLPSLMIRR